MSIFRQLSALLLFTGLASTVVFGQSYVTDMARQSARSDIRTGGTIEKSELEPNDPDVTLTVNVPSFDMTLWQSGKEINKYYVGIGLKDFPIFVGLRRIDTVIWNPAWIPPSSKWVDPSLHGKYIGPADPRNPLGKIKIPLGYGYLIHQAKSSRDIGSLVSHGCLRVMRNDLYDLNDKLLLAQGLNVKNEVARAKRNRKTYVIELPESVLLEVTYDTLVVEDGQLHIYPDVYGHRNDKIGALRTELQVNGVDVSNVADEILEKMIRKAVKKSQYVIGIEDLRAGRFMNGRVLPVVPGAGRTG